MKLLQFKLAPLSTDESAFSRHEDLTLTGWDETLPADEHAQFAILWPETSTTFTPPDYAPAFSETPPPVVREELVPTEKAEGRTVPIICVFPWLKPAESPEDPHQPITCVFPPPKPVEVTERPNKPFVCVFPVLQPVESPTSVPDDGLWGSTPEFPCQYQPTVRLKPGTAATPETPGSQPPLAPLVFPDFVPPVNAADPLLGWAI